jgi:hypothetical protein
MRTIRVRNSQARGGQCHRQDVNASHGNAVPSADLSKDAVTRFEARADYVPYVED